MSHLENLGGMFEVLIGPDKDGYVGRQCPKEACGGYFKIVPGTGSPGESALRICPYCGHKAPPGDFATNDQTEYAVSVAHEEVLVALLADLDQMCDDLNRQSSLLKFGPVRRGEPALIHQYLEKLLETEVICASCTLRYSIYGVFGYCPDCGIHNTTDILSKNFDLIEKMLSLAGTADPDLATQLIENALEDAVSAFDGFGRESCRVALIAQSKAVPRKLSFQNLAGAQEKVRNLLNYDLASCLSPDEWAMACRCFKKRNLVAHKLGVVDDEYLKQAHDPEAVIGRKIRIRPDEVRELVAILRKLGTGLAQATGPAKT